MQFATTAVYARMQAVYKMNTSMLPTQNKLQNRLNSKSIISNDIPNFSKLSLIASVLTLTGILVFRSFMANSSIARIVVILSIAVMNVLQWKYQQMMNVSTAV